MSIILDGTNGITSAGSVNVDEVKDKAGTGAPSVLYENTDSNLTATDVQGAIDETADSVGLALIKSGIDPAVARAVAYNDIGAPVAGGYFAGVIDTVKGTIQGNDDYQTGERYALIVAPKELEGGRGSSPAPGLTTGDLRWDTTRTTAGEAGTLTRWDGLSATDVIIAKDEAKYEAHNFIKECRDLYPAPATAGGSNWYLPALDELELLYRNFKPNYADNLIFSQTRNFPGAQSSGVNPSSDPTSTANSNSPRVPEKTPVLGFRETEAAAVDLDRYWSTTDANEDGRAWNQLFTGSGFEGLQLASDKDRTDVSVRPVRRVAL